ncbi:MAG TPA: hypothetical protein VGH49_15070 [Xanthobacteraceae bacterium]
MAVRRHVRNRLACAVALLGAGILCALPARAEVSIVEAGSGTLVVEAHDATVRQVLEALSASRNIQFRASEALSQIVTGTYSGTLPHVLARILGGYDTVIVSTASGVRLTVLAAAGTARPVVSISAVRANPATASIAAPQTMPVNATRTVSSNVDLDEEAAEGATGQARPAYAAAPAVPLSIVNSSASVPPTMTINSQGSSARPHISANVDLDEEKSR